MLKAAPTEDSMVGQSWSTAQEKELAEAYYLGASLREMVKITGRREGGVVARLSHLGVIRQEPNRQLVDMTTGREIVL